MGFPLVSCLMDACTLESALMQHRLKMNVGIRWYNETYTSLCHNVTQVVTWPITSYEVAGRNPQPRGSRSIDLARKTHFISVLKLKNPPIDLIFGLVNTTERRQSLHVFNFYLLVLFLRKSKELLIQQRKRICKWNSLFFFPVISRPFFTEKPMVDPWLKSKDRAKKPSKNDHIKSRTDAERTISRFVAYRTITLPFLLWRNQHYSPWN